MKLSRKRQGDNAPMAVMEFIDRPGEIRAAKPPPSRLVRNLMGSKEMKGLPDVLAEVGIKSNV